MKFLLVFFTLFCIGNCAKILFFSYVPSVSHQNVFKPIWRELSLRGHEVYAITTNPIGDPKLTNLTEINVSVGYEVYKNHDFSNLRREFKSALKCAQSYMDGFAGALDLEIKSDGFQELMKKPSDFFDLIIVEVHHPIAYGIQHKFKAPMIAISSLGVGSFYHYVFGNTFHPILYPEFMTEIAVAGSKMSLMQKLDSFTLTITGWVNSRFTSSSLTKQARKYFGEDLVDIETHMNNVSLVLLNVDPIFSDRRPNLPHIIEFFNIHLGKTSPLPNDLKQILDDSKNGFIFVSLGTNVRFEHVRPDIKQGILDALSELPYTVLCKWNPNDINKTSNVIFRPWFPQQAILAHPNIKVFVTQGGLQSSEEAIANGVPVVVIPFTGDQPLNAKIMKNNGMAELVSPNSVTKDILLSKILQVASNESYRAKARALQYIFFDQPQSGLEKVIWWCEYVIRHNGAKHLRSPSADISLYEYFLLDVLGVLLAACWLCYLVAKFILRKLITIIKRNISTKEKTS